MAFPHARTFAAEAGAGLAVALVEPWKFAAEAVVEFRWYLVEGGSPSATAASRPAPRAPAFTGSATCSMVRPTTSAKIRHHTPGPAAAGEPDRLEQAAGEALHRPQQPARVERHPSKAVNQSEWTID
jgi:hypothetical protein